MCVEIKNTTKSSLKIKKILKIFKKSSDKLDSTTAEALENEQNMEMVENTANEKICQYEEEEYVPVHYARTEHGTIFWTQNQMPVFHFQDRWAQA